MVSREQPVIIERNLNVLYFFLRPHVVNTHLIYKVAVAMRLSFRCMDSSIPYLYITTICRKILATS